jgi:hypothetical protein
MIAVTYQSAVNVSQPRCQMPRRQRIDRIVRRAVLRAVCECIEPRVLRPAPRGASPAL